MKFKEFYIDAQRELTETFISMFAKGKPEYAAHLRWLFENKEKEKLVQEPVFQSIFPWESYGNPMNSLTDLLGREFVNALDEATFEGDKSVAFPKDRHPFKHQVASWEAVLKSNKSIVVTTGTGSGKTECFMVPVLKELYDIKKSDSTHNPGVQAIFLYPLNALISSQRKRIHAWCDALAPKITYGIYTGETKEEEYAEVRRNNYPQIVDRKSMRENPPQILFANPTILEYMMVRKADQPIVEKSKDLKWIILDEAHTYNGSTATEMAILIRRVLQLFGKEPSQVKFALTSATIGEGKEEEMRIFISNLTGKNATEFEFIGGKREIPSLDNYTLKDVNREFNLNITAKQIDNLRRELNQTPALSLKEICSKLGFDGTIEERLGLVDALSKSGSATVQGNPSALLPVRAHFFGRSISGVYACTNPECSRYRESHIGIGSLTTIASQTCPVCKGKLLEVVRCDSCGEYLLQGEKIDDHLPASPVKYAMKDNTVYFQRLSDFDLDDEEDDDNANGGVANLADDLGHYPLLLSGRKDSKPFNGAELYDCKLNSIDGEFIDTKRGEGDFVYSNEPGGRNPNMLLCPACGEKQYNCQKLLFPSSLESRLLFHVFLKQSPPLEDAPNPSALIYEGRKFITFTDNRQGTANIAQAANISVEREWMRSQILHLLINDKLDNERNIDREQLIAKINRYSADPECQSDVEEWKTKLNYKPLVSWNELSNRLAGSIDLQTLFQQLGKDDAGNEKDQYLKAMFVDQMGNKPLRSNSLETLGLVHLEYPAINQIGLNEVPSSFKHFYGYTDQQVALSDWKDFLRICLDYQIRRNVYLDIPEGIRNLVTQSYYSDPVFSSEVNPKTERENGEKCKRWPAFSKPAFSKIDNGQRIARLPLLLLLAKGITCQNDITAENEGDVNEILSEAWNFLTKNILVKKEEVKETKSGIRYFWGYKLDIFDSDRVKLSFIDKATICPMTNQLLDCTFRGISPMVKGHLDPHTLANYRVVRPFVDVPKIDKKEDDFTQGGKFDKERWQKCVIEWFDQSFKPAMQSIGGDLNIQLRLFQKRPIFITQEHSAQIKSEDLRESEKKFEEGKLNVLSCSTTMEMGVDIGGISSVMMNNVPPKPANYQQRAGRAGRRSETQSLAYTICGDTPIGREVLDNPKWALDHAIESPSMTLSSSTIMQRHINSFLLGSYFQSGGGTSVTEKIGTFVYGREYVQDVKEEDRDKDRNIPLLDYNYDGFKKELNEFRIDEKVAAQVAVIVKGTIYETIPIDNLISQTQISIEKVCEEVKSIVESLDDDKEHTENSHYKKRLELRKKNLWKHNLLTYLSERNFLPSSSIPTNIAGLIAGGNHKQTETREDDQKIKTSRPLSIAIQEYAPGREIVIGNLVYPVVGIQNKTKEQNIAKNPILKDLSICSCGYVSFSSIVLKKCPNCGKENFRSIFGGPTGRATLAVEPSGFIAGDSRRTKKPKVSRSFIEPELLGMETWSKSANKDELYRVRTSAKRDSQVLHFNKANGYGYAYCYYCGKMVAENGLADSAVPLPDGMDEHKDISTGCKCEGPKNNAIKRNVVLSACYSTDLTEMKICGGYDDNAELEVLLYTLGTAICETFTRKLGINSDEIWFGVTRKHTLFFYDTASGGAGYANQLPNYIEKVLDEVYAKLKDCHCEIACTHCLIDRKSQWFIDKLDKRIAVKWLENERTSRDVIPDDLQRKVGNRETHKLTHDMLSEFMTRLGRDNMQSVHYFLTDGLKGDILLTQIEHDLLLSAIHGKSVYMVVSRSDAALNSLPAALWGDLNTMKSRFSGLYFVKSCPDEVKPIVEFRYDNMTKTFVSYQDSIYCVTDFERLKVEPFDLKQPQETSNEVCYVTELKKDKVISSSLLHWILGEEKERSLESFLKDKDKNVKASYSDIYISNPMACILLAQVLRQFQQAFKLSITGVKVSTGKSFKYNPNFNDYLTDDFRSVTERDEFFEESVKENLDLEPRLETDGLLTHSRLLTISNPEFEIIINPDGGFAQGWKAFSRDARSNTPNIETMPIELTNIPAQNDHSIRYTICWRKL